MRTTRLSRHRTPGGGRAGPRPRGGRLRSLARARLRDSGRDPDDARARRRPRRDVDGPGGPRRAPPGHPLSRTLVRDERGRRRTAGADRPRARARGRAPPRLSSVDLRDLPSVDRLLADETLAGAPRSLALAAARAALDGARRTIGSGGDPGDVAALARAELERLDAPSLRRVLNATGVIVHTNLGRAPLAQAALARVVEVGGSYSNLELDLESGARGSRQSHVADALCRLTGAEASLVVNNNAAAVLLAVAALAEGREVVVSRGELVEIGDGFRIPDVLARSGARMVEIGTTNRTRAADY